MDTVDKSIMAFMQEWELPGASVAIAKDGKLIYARGFGYANLEHRELVQPFYRFRIASISKPLTSTAIFQLIDKGLLSLNASVFGPSGILNDTVFLDIIDKRYYDITIEELLSHTAGWRRYGNDKDPMFSSAMIADYFGSSLAASKQQIIRYMLKQQLDYTPGADQAYSNFGYCILGRVIEKISGETYEQYVKKNILNIIGASSFELGGTYESDKKENEVTYYDNPGAPAVPGYFDHQRVPAPYGGFDITAMDSHGGWIASAPDLLRFALSVDGRNSRMDVISEAAADSMKAKSFPSGSFAHGWISDEGGICHAGLLPGSSGYLVVRTDGLAIAVLFNSHSYKNDFFPAMSKAIWTSLRAVTSFPKSDFFEGTCDPRF